eukprot:gene11324-12761_t
MQFTIASPAHKQREVKQVMVRSLLGYTIVVDYTQFDVAGPMSQIADFLAAKEGYVVERISFHGKDVRLDCAIQMYLSKGMSHGSRLEILPRRRGGAALAAGGEDDFDDLDDAFGKDVDLAAMLVHGMAARHDEPAMVATKPTRVDLPDFVKRYPFCDPAMLSARLLPGSPMLLRTAKLECTRRIVLGDGRDDKVTDFAIDFVGRPPELAQCDGRKGWLSKSLATDNDWNVFNAAVIGVKPYQSKLIGFECALVPEYAGLMDFRLALWIKQIFRIPAKNMFGFADVLAVDGDGNPMVARDPSELLTTEGAAFLSAPFTDTNKGQFNLPMITDFLIKALDGNHKLDSVFIAVPSVGYTDTCNFTATFTLGRLQQYVVGMTVVSGVQRHTAGGVLSMMDAPVIVVQLRRSTPGRRRVQIARQELRNNTVQRPAWLQKRATPEILVSYDASAYRTDRAVLGDVLGEGAGEVATFRVVSFTGARRELLVQVNDMDCVVKWSTDRFTVVPAATIASRDVRHFKVFTRRDAVVHRDVRMTNVLDRFRGREAAGIYAKAMTGDRIGVHLMVPDALPADISLDQVMSFDAATYTFVEIPVAGHEPRGQRRQEDAERYSASGQTMTNINDRFVAEVAKVKLADKVVVDAFPMVTRVVADIPANAGLGDEIAEFLICMGPDVKTRAMGTRRLRVTATGIEPIAAAVLAGMQMELSSGSVMFTAGEPRQMKTAQQSLSRVKSISEWREELMKDAERQLPKGWAYKRIADVDGAPGSAAEVAPSPDTPHGKGAQHGKGMNEGKGSPPKKPSAAAGASAASPQRTDVLLGKALEAAMEKADELGGLNQQNRTQLERALRDVGDVRKLRLVASAESKAAFVDAVKNKIG